MKKRILSALLCMAMVASLVVGCGGKEEPVAAPEAPAATEEAPAAEEEAAEPELGGTIEVAVTIPTPEIRPQERYFIIASFVFGLWISIDEATNCSPYRGLILNSPSSITLSQIPTTGNFPVAVIMEPSSRVTSRIVYPVSSFLKMTFSIIPVIFIIVGYN